MVRGVTIKDHWSEQRIFDQRSLVAGVPGKVRRELSEAERDGIRRNAAAYLRHVEEHTAPVD